MAKRRYIIERVGDEFIPVQQESHPGATRATWGLWGGIITLIGLRRGGLTGLGVAVAGGMMIYRGATGRTPSLGAMFQSCCGTDQNGPAAMTPSYQNDVKGSRQLPADGVDEASMESFPASDPPAKMSVELPR